ncbi:hypothetical protein [Leptolyngbya sp. 'hensonii']|uniref:hypothetical protein n=1 Tax=Leptolyngbya sp. 'hensonii' TaxID=1922337 RepID=UPI000AACB9F2|nr:hypothetical protein [Leptolyngbya sp. 'hensonii']
MTRYKNRDRIESARYPHWNYAANGNYFVTICTCDQTWFFDRVLSGVMQLSEIGNI